MKKSILIALLFVTTNLFAQQQIEPILFKEMPSIETDLSQESQEIDALTKKINNQEILFNQHKKELEALTIKFKNKESVIDSLRQFIQTNSQNIAANSSDLGSKISQTEVAAKDGISKLNKDFNQSRLQWIIAILVTLVLGGLTYWLLSKRIKLNKTDVETQIKNTKTALEEESVKLDSKLLEIMEAQLKVQEEEVTLQPVISNEEPDHSLALKVADEIVRMQKNISKMEKTTKGLKPLLKGIERIQNNFAANGYEMINLLNTDYDERNNIDVVNFITDESLVEGERIISAVIKPQVNFNGVLVQKAQVDVSQN